MSFTEKQFADQVINAWISQGRVLPLRDGVVDLSALASLVSTFLSQKLKEERVAEILAASEAQTKALVEEGWQPSDFANALKNLMVDPDPQAEPSSCQASEQGRLYTVTLKSVQIVVEKADVTIFASSPMKARLIAKEAYESDLIDAQWEDDELVGSATIAVSAV